MKTHWFMLPLLAAFLLSGCTAATWRSVAQGMAEAGNGYQPYGATSYAATAAAQKLMVFGGSDHRTYLGCLNCSEYNSDSVLNSYGSYGSSYSSTSIYNTYGQYGSPYVPTSACNPYASSPPVVVDSAGNFYGYLTLNAYKGGAITNPKIVAWLHGVCGG